MFTMYPQVLHLDIFKDLELCDLVLQVVNEPLVLQRLRLDKLELPQHLLVKEHEPHTLPAISSAPVTQTVTLEQSHTSGTCECLPIRYTSNSS